MNSVVQPEIEKKWVWGFWPTIGFGAVLLVFSFFIQTIVSTIFFVVKLIHDSPSEPTEIEIFNWMMNSDMGLFLSLSIIFSAIFCTGLVLVIVRARRGLPIKDYLGMKTATARAYIIGLLVTLAYIGGSALIDYLLNRNVQTDVLTDSYLTTSVPVMFWLAVVVFGPVFEEIFFRGFLYEGFKSSKIRIVGAVLLTSLLWAVSHLQYSLFGILNIFVLGIILGIVRYKAGSVWVPLAMHVANNFIAVLLISLDLGM